MRETRFLLIAFLVTCTACHATAPGDVYRVRYGTLPGRCVECPIDAISASEPVEPDGPFERDVRLDPSDVFVRATSDPRILCVDVQPSALPHEQYRRVIVLDVTPVDGAAPYPYAVDARTHQRLSVDASELLDEYNYPCDSRWFARRFWDDNLLRWHRLHRQRR
jgi:hypothetical protein